jgi:hypothetical protein
MAEATSKIEKVVETVQVEKDVRQITLTMSEREAGVLFALLGKVNSAGGRESGDLYDALSDLHEGNSFPVPALVQGVYGDKPLGNVPVIQIVWKK